MEVVEEENIYRQLQLERQAQLTFAKGLDMCISMFCAVCVHSVLLCVHSVFAAQQHAGACGITRAMIGKITQHNKRPPRPSCKDVGCACMTGAGCHHCSSHIDDGAAAADLILLPRFPHAFLPPLPSEPLLSAPFTSLHSSHFCPPA